MAGYVFYTRPFIFKADTLLKNARHPTTKAVRKLAAWADEEGFTLKCKQCGGREGITKRNFCAFVEPFSQHLAAKKWGRKALQSDADPSYFWKRT